MSIVLAEISEDVEGCSDGWHGLKASGRCQSRGTVLNDANYQGTDVPRSAIFSVVVIAGRNGDPNSDESSYGSYSGRTSEKKRIQLPCMMAVMSSST